MSFWNPGTVIYVPFTEQISHRKIVGDVQPPPSISRSLLATLQCKSDDSVEAHKNVCIIHYNIVMFRSGPRFNMIRINEGNKRLG